VEYVAQFDPATVQTPPDRLLAVAERFGGQIRSSETRDAEASFALLVAARDRYPVGAVRRHVCRHDEGIGDCRPTIVEG
jgi:hypothetical protein